MNRRDFLQTAGAAGLLLSARESANLAMTVKAPEASGEASGQEKDWVVHDYDLGL
ncbi:MAG: twin-arginine translocation signal domain-containing protein [Terriglobia bacterium]